MRQNTSGECLDVRETGTLFLSHERRSRYEQHLKTGTLERGRWRALV